MADHTLEAQNTVIAGMTGSGKTTLVIKLLLNSHAACNFVFDDENRTAPRLRLRSCYTLRDCESALSGRWVVFNGKLMFQAKEGDRSIFDAKRRAFRWWCEWLFEVAGRGPGLKNISLPEIWRFCTPDSIPPEFATLAQMGRELNTHLIMDTQRPELVNPSITGAATEVICFKLLPSGQPDCPIKTVSRLGFDGGAVSRLNLGQFVALNRMSGGTLAGKMF